MILLNCDNMGISSEDVREVKSHMEERGYNHVEENGVCFFERGTQGFVLDPQNGYVGFYRVIPNREKIEIQYMLANPFRLNVLKNA